jgi:hypothetical protein
MTRRTSTGRASNADEVADIIVYISCVRRGKTLN